MCKGKDILKLLDHTKKLTIMYMGNLQPSVCINCVLIKNKKCILASKVCCWSSSIILISGIFNPQHSYKLGS